MLKYTDFSDSNWMGVIGLEFNKGEVHGKMGFLELTVQFLQSGTGLTSFRLKIRLGVSFTSLLSICRELLVDLAALL